MQMNANECKTLWVGVSRSKLEHFRVYFQAMFPIRSDENEMLHFFHTIASSRYMSRRSANDQ